MCVWLVNLVNEDQPSPEVYDPLKKQKLSPFPEGFGLSFLILFMIKKQPY